MAEESFAFHTSNVGHNANDLHVIGLCWSSAVGFNSLTISSFLRVSSSHFASFLLSCVMFRLSQLGAVTLISSLVSAQFPIPPTGQRVIQSSSQPGVSIAYKQVCTDLTALLSTIPMPLEGDV